jgi:hypothetical protein
MNADERSDDDSRRRRHPPSVPEEAWIDAFDTQCTSEMLKRLQRFAAWWARILGGESAGNDAYYAEELVQNALGDTLEGVLRWDPKSGDLEPFLIDVIRLRARRDRKRARRHQHVSIDELGLDGSLSSPELIEDADTIVTAMTRTMTRLRALSADDSLAQRFLDAVDQEATTRVEVMRIGGLTSDQYHNTRRRLARLITQLEPDLTPRQRK